MVTQTHPSGVAVPGDPRSAHSLRVVEDGVGRLASPPIAYRRRPGGGLAVLNPLSYGVTIDGLADASEQHAFLEAMGAGYDLTIYDQRGAGRSAGAGAPADWRELGADVWRVADAAGIRRAVLYGVADGGHTIAHAAVLNPDRVLGLIFNAVPPAFTPDATMAVTVPLTGDEADSGGSVLRSFGVNAADAAVLASRWERQTAADAAQRRRELIATADLRDLLPRLSQPALVIEPSSRFSGWGDALGSLLPDARIAHPTRGIQAVGAIHAFLALLSADLGREASKLSPELSATVASSERSVGDLRCVAVAVDDDAASGRAVELACRLGDPRKTAIVLVHVVQVPYALPLERPPHEATERGARAIELGEAIVKRHRRSLCRSRVLNSRSVAGGLVTAAREEAADLIVLSESQDDRAGGSAIVSEVLRRAPGKVIVDRGGGDEPR